MVNPLLLGYDIKNGATLQELPVKEKMKKLLLEIERKESKKLKRCTTRVNENYQGR